MSDLLKLFTDKRKEFLNFLKSRYHLYHLSNVFFRDMHYGVMAFLAMNGTKVKYTQAEELTKKVIESLEQANILVKADRLAWVLTYPDFKKPPVKPAAPAKPSTPAKPAAAPAKPQPTSEATPASA
ncbi:MAG TPA: hypothetical protein VNN76_01060 [Bacteroidota bacterium]|nr:hypothetical protein [Bacteroidota bacterium]